VDRGNDEGPVPVADYFRLELADFDRYERGTGKRFYSSSN
jgi:hypothetical protein